MTSPTEYWTMPKQKALMALGLWFVLGIVLGLVAGLLMFDILLN